MEKQNRVLANEIGRLGIDAGDSSTSSPVRPEDRTYNPRTWGQNDVSESNQRYGEFRKQGLAMVDDLLPQTRFGASAQSDTRQGIEPAEDEFGEIDVGPGATGYASKLLQADTKLISIGKPKPDPRPLSQLDVMDVPEFENRVTQEVRQDRIVEKLSKLPPEFRLEELKRKNLDFESLMNEMVKECRHIYEDQVGIKPIRKGEPEDTLDQIIENLYNDDFKIKNLPPKAASTATEDILSPAPRYVQAPYHSKMYNMNIDPAAQLPHDSSHFDPSKTINLSTSPLTPSKQGPANSLPLAAADDSFGMSPHSDPHNGHLDGSSHEPNPYLQAAAHRAESSPNGDNPFKENNDERGSGEDSPTFGKSGEVPFGQKEGAEKGDEGEGEHASLHESANSPARRARQHRRQRAARRFAAGRDRRQPGGAGGRPEALWFRDRAGPRHPQFQRCGHPRRLRFCPGQCAGDPDRQLHRHRCQRARRARQWQRHRRRCAQRARLGLLQLARDRRLLAVFS